MYSVVLAVLYGCDLSSAADSALRSELLKESCSYQERRSRRL